MLRVATIPVGPLEVNCYLAWDEATGQALVVDPGDDPAEVVAEVRRLKLVPRGILLTHGHVDHIRGVGPVAAGFAIPVYISAADRRLYESPHNALLPWLAAAEGLPQSQDAPVLLAGLGPAVISTPGHTPGSVCFHFAGAGVLFSGDTLFAGSVGRTDLPGGDSEALLSSIRSRLLVLPPGTSVLPGHGPPTTIGEETRTNPFL